MTKTGKYIIVILPILILGLIIFFFSNIVIYILISYIFSLIGHPLVKYLGKIKIKTYQIPKSLRSFITILLIWSLFILFFRIFIPLAANQANELSKIDISSLVAQFEQPIKEVQDFINQLYVTNKKISFESFISNKASVLLNTSTLTNFLGSIASIVGNIAIAFIAISFITFFFLKDEELFSEGIMLFIPERHKEKIMHVLFSTKKLLTRYFIGIVLQISGIILLITLGMTIIGIEFKNGLVIGLLAGIFNVIPYLGPIIGTTVGMLLGMATQFHQEPNLFPFMGYMLIVFVCVQVIDNLVFQPFIYSSSVHAHPLEIFLVILIAGSMAGIIGMLLAIPIYTIIRVIAKEFFSNFEIVQKITHKL